MLKTFDDFFSKNQYLVLLFNNDLDIFEYFLLHFVKSTSEKEIIKWIYNIANNATLKPQNPYDLIENRYILRIALFRLYRLSCSHTHCSRFGFDVAIKFQKLELTVKPPTILTF